MQNSAVGMGMPSIQNDGCIIEEQHDHLVIALRVPKELISANLPLLAALAELSAPSAKRIAAPYVATDPPRNYRYFSGFKFLQIFGIAAIVTIHMPSIDGDVAHANAPKSTTALISQDALYPEYVFPHIKGLEYCTSDALTAV
jgi:hypothetical protein